jgi:hypothetical protein
MVIGHSLICQDMISGNTFNQPQNQPVMKRNTNGRFLIYHGPNDIHSAMITWATQLYPKDIPATHSAYGYTSRKDINRLINQMCGLPTGNMACVRDFIKVLQLIELAQVLMTGRQADMDYVNRLDRSNHYCYKQHEFKALPAPIQ